MFSQRRARSAWATQVSEKLRVSQFRLPFALCPLEPYTKTLYVAYAEGIQKQWVMRRLRRALNVVRSWSNRGASENAGVRRQDGDAQILGRRKTF